MLPSKNNVDSVIYSNKHSKSREMNRKIIDVANSEEKQIGQLLYYEDFPLRTFHQTLICNC